ncbi:MAG TPA: energy transducer TonB [Chthoniobacterales bacterium]|nr:energy transducer TonB [Chthoniobacterales bacterium]
MSIPPVIRSLVAIGAIATLCSTPVLSKAGEQNPLVVVGVSPEAVAISCPTPTYPPECVRMRIQGNVEVSIWVQNGKMVKVKAAAANPLLAGMSSRWVHRNWQFKPSTTGLYILPIIYQLDLG